MRKKSPLTWNQALSVVPGVLKQGGLYVYVVDGWRAPTSLSSLKIKSSNRPKRVPNNDFPTDSFL